MRSALVLLMLCGLAVTVSAADYYIDVAAGNDTTGLGTLAAPWKTMVKAETVATGGDTVYLRAGTYPRFMANARYAPLRTDYLTWKPFPGESVTIEGLNVGRYWTQPTFGGYICYMIFDGFHIHDTTTDAGSVVACNGARYLKLLNCTIHGFRDLAAGTGSNFVINSRENRDIYIENCDISEAHFAVYLWGWDMTLKKSKVHGAHEDAVRIINCLNGLVEDCEIYDVGEGDDLHNDGIQWFSTVSGDAAQYVPCENITIRRTHIYNIEDQDILGNTAPFGLHTNFLFEDLLLEQTPSQAWELNIGDTQAVVRNCTVIGSMRFMPNGVGDVRNCIASTMSWESPTTKIYQDYNSFGQVQGNTAGPHDLIGLDPKFADPANLDFSLQPGSPCIDSGTSIASAATDFNQSRRIDVRGVANQGGGDQPYFDIGAFEFQGAVGGDRCATLTVSSTDLGTGSGVVTVTALGYWEATLRESTGGGLASFYDLTADPGKTVNLSSVLPAGRRLLDATYFGQSVFSGSPAGRTLSIVSGDAQRVVVKVTGVQPAGTLGNLPLEACFTFNAPVYEGSFIDLEFLIENNTAAAVEAGNCAATLGLPALAAFNWWGSGPSAAEPADRWIKAAVGPGSTVANLATGRYFRVTELSFDAAGAAPDTTPPNLALPGPASRPLDPGKSLYDHFVLEMNIRATPALFVTATNLGTGTGLATITCPHYYEFVLDESVGGGIRALYDLRVDPYRKVNLGDTTWYSARMFDLRVAYGPMLLTNNLTNRLAVTTETPGQVAVSCTGTLALSTGTLSSRTVSTFAPPTSAVTTVGLDVTFTNNSGLTLTSATDFLNLQVAPNPAGLSFDWQGSSDTATDHHWLRATTGPAATVAPLTPNTYIQLQEFTYGNVAAADLVPSNLTFRLGSGNYAIGEVRQRAFALTTNIFAPPLPTVTAGGALSRNWVYQNTPLTTGLRHAVTLTVAVAGTTSFTVDVQQDVASQGAVTIEPTADPLVWTIRGSLRQGAGGTLGTGPVTLDITVTDTPSGATGQGTVSLTSRQLGDIDGVGGVSGQDKLLMNKRLNGLLPDGPQYDLDGLGGASGQDKLILNKILNGLILP